MDSVGQGEGGKIWENGIETCPALRPHPRGPLLLSERKCWHLVEVTCRISPKVLEDQHTVCRLGTPLWLASQQGSPGRARAASPSGSLQQVSQVAGDWDVRPAQCRFTCSCPTPASWPDEGTHGSLCSATWSFYHLCACCYLGSWPSTPCPRHNPPLKIYQQARGCFNSQRYTGSCSSH